MERLKQKLQYFMQGRYGIDQLYIAILVTYFILLFLSRYFESIALVISLWLLIFWAIFRVFSKNIAKRYAENQFLLKVIKQVKSYFSLQIKRIKDSRTHRYRKCSNCGTTLRLPRKRGKHTAKCPRCQHRFQVTVWL
ncbi:hypothetical protein [Amphibacillus sediminis]|uniref:hypothetical protein n=1 Tax=Amphibacillus sediminis TaxID=360185 RepID=UPI00082F563E|nr:hypothetical protein [Amphibacillus sediminis]